MVKMGIITLVHLSSKKLSLDILLLLFIKQKKKEVYMSSLYLKYLKEKKENEDTYYLFKVGNFYIFIDEDAKKISKVVPLKLTNLTSDILKCGFPINALERYLTIFKNLSEALSLSRSTLYAVSYIAIPFSVRKSLIGSIINLRSASFQK